MILVNCYIVIYKLIVNVGFLRRKFNLSVLTFYYYFVWIFVWKSIDVCLEIMFL